MATQLSVHYIENNTSVCPLFCQYNGQFQPQPAYIYLDCDEGILGADYSGEIGNGAPSTVWHSRELRWNIDCYLNRQGINRRLEHIAELAQTILNGYDTDWNGSNLVGTFTAEAREAIDEIETWLYHETSDPDETGNITSCSEWFQYDDLSHLWPEGVTLEDAARELRENPGDDVEFTDDPEDYLLERAQHEFDPYSRRHDSPINGGLHRLQLDALLAACLIDEDDIETEEADEDSDD